MDTEASGAVEVGKTICFCVGVEAEVIIFNGEGSGSTPVRVRSGSGEGGAGRVEGTVKQAASEARQINPIKLERIDFNRYPFFTCFFYEENGNSIQIKVCCSTKPASRMAWLDCRAG